MRIACSTSAFKMPLADALKEIAAIGFAHVDLICIEGFGHIIPAELAAAFDDVAAGVERVLAETRLTPIALNSAYGNLYARDDADANAKRLVEVEAVAALAHRLGAKIASFFPGGNWPAEEMDWDDVLAGETATIREMLAVGAKHGVTFVIEPHFATPFQTLSQVSRLLEAVPELKIAYDPSHFAMQSIPLEQTFPLLDRAAHVHMRDAAPDKMQVPTGTGTVDFGKLVSALAERSYSGDLSIEYLPDLEGGATQSIEALRNLLPKA